MRHLQPASSIRRRSVAPFDLTPSCPWSRVGRRRRRRGNPECHGHGKRAGRRVRHVQRHQPAARPQHAQHLGERRRQAGQVAQQEAARHRVEGVVGEGKLQRVAQQPAQSPVVDARLATPGHQHRPGEVARDHPGDAGAAQVAGQIARARAQVQHDAPARARPVEGGAHGPPPPAAIHAARHQPVHQVVARHDLREHRSHLGRPRAGWQRRRDAGGGAQGRWIELRHVGLSVLRPRRPTRAARPAQRRIGFVHREGGW